MLLNSCPFITQAVVEISIDGNAVKSAQHWCYHTIRRVVDRIALHHYYYYSYLKMWRKMDDVDDDCGFLPLRLQVRAACLHGDEWRVVVAVIDAIPLGLSIALPEVYVDVADVPRVHHRTPHGC